MLAEGLRRSPIQTDRRFGSLGRKSRSPASSARPSDYPAASPFGRSSRTCSPFTKSLSGRFATASDVGDFFLP